MRKLFLVPALAGVALSAMLATPASAADTTVTVTVSGEGGLTISVPGSSDLGSAVPGATASGGVGPVTVSDQRALLNASWTATVSTTDFTTGGGTPAETIPAADVTYWSGPATSTTGSGTFNPGQATAANAQAINVPRTAFSLAGGTGVNTATWDPTLLIQLPAAAVAGTYTGTVTHSVL